MRAICFAGVLSLFSPAVSVVAEDRPLQAFQLLAEYDRPGLPVPHWTFNIVQGGQTEYQRTYAAPALGASDAPIHFRLSASGQAKLQKFIADSKAMQPCETKTKGLARMGQKTLEYRDGTGVTLRCSFNYTDNKALAAATDYLLAVSYTLEEGAAIDRLHRYDRLGLDPVLIRLAEAAKEGKAPELAAIKPSLQALVADDAILERVRTKASQLLLLADQQ